MGNKRNGIKRKVNDNQTEDLNETKNNSVSDDEVHQLCFFLYLIILIVAFLGAFRIIECYKR